MKAATEHTRPCGWAVMALAGAALLAAAGCEPMMQAQRPVTILLMEYQGDNAVAQAEALRQQIAGLGLPDVFIVSGAGQASVCVGRFPAWSDKKAHDTLAYVHQIRDPDGQYPFASTLLTSVPEPLPENPWPLEKANGSYTIQVAAWEAPGRGPKAQAYAAQLRDQGYEAYVYHGPRLSIVTVGVFGPKIFDHPELVGHVDPPNLKGTPTPKPQIIDPTVLSLMHKFPWVQLEGHEPSSEARVASPLIAVPGHEAPYRIDTSIPAAIYRITLQLVNTRTGIADTPLMGTGVAPFKSQTQAVAAILTQQVLSRLPAGQPVRIGVAGVLAMDDNAAKQKADAAALEAAVKVLEAAGGNVTVVSQDETQQLITASRHTLDEVLIDPRTLRGVKGLDFVLTGSVTTIARQN